MKRITVTASRSYDVIIGKGLLPGIGRFVGQVMPACRLCIVADSNVDVIFGRQMQSALSAEGYNVCKFVFAAGEMSKNIDTLTQLLDFLAENQFTRSDGIIALGGGVTGDLAGFAAATYLRGIEYIQVPTTLLSAVDSSVGGKTGINAPAGKNLIGAFWQPSLVLCDCETFDSLPSEKYLDGIAEAIKYGMIMDLQLLQHLKNRTISEEELVECCIKNKNSIVQKDERDNSARQLLNFGHTLGHAIEKCSNYSISHGHAVSLGMLMVCKAAFRMELMNENCAPYLEELLVSYGFSTKCEFAASELAKVAMNDKKRRGSIITIVIPEKLGICRLATLEISLLEEFIGYGC